MNLFQLMTDGVNLDALPTESENKREPIAFEPSPSGGFSVPSDLNAAFDAAASDFGIDADVLRAVAHTESRFNPDVVSGKVKSRTGAIGLMQFMPDTAKEYGINPVDPVESIFGAAAYLRKSLDKFDGDYGKAVASYNAGPNRKDFDSEDWDKRMPAETQDYLRKVFTAADKLKQGAPAAPTPQPATDTGDETARLAARYKAPRMERTMGQAVSDTGAQLAEGVNNILGAVPNLIAPDSGVAQFFKGNADTAQNWQSDAIKQRTASAGAAIDKAGEDGVIAQVVEAAKQYSSDPALAARFVVTNLPSMIPGIGAAKLAQAAALARGATLAQAAATATTVAGGMNAALNAGGARGEAFDDLKATLMKQGVPEAKATEQALTGSLLPAAIGGVAGFISGKTGLEGAIVGKAGAKAAVTAGAKSLGAELGGEQLEEVAPKLATNYQASQFDNRSLGKDVGRTMVETAIGSGPGSIFSGVQAAANTRTAPTVESQPTTPTAPPVVPATPNPDASQAVGNIASLIKQAEAQADGAPDTAVTSVEPEKQAASFAQRTATPTPLPGAVPQTTPADAGVRAMVDSIKKKRAQDAEETLQIQQMLAEDDAKAEALRASSTEETTNGQAEQIAIKARASLIDDLVSSYAEPSEFFASRVLPAVDKQLAVLGRPPLAKDERARVDALLGSTRAFIRPSLPSAPEAAPVLTDAGADNSSLERLIKPKKPAVTGLAAEMAALKARSQPQATQPDAPAAPQPVTGGLAAEMSAIKSRNQAATTVDPAKPAPVGIGRNNTPLAEGGKPFKTKAEADTARKLQPMMRVKKEGKGFVLVEKTPAQIAAQEKAARRNLGSVGAGGGPLSAHAFLASQGGLSKSAMADLGFDKNVRVGSKWLFTNTGMTLEGMTEALQQNGYVQSTEQNPAIELVKRSANGQPQYTAEGWDQIAQAEATARFEDHLAAQQEAAMADDEFDPFSPENLSGDFEGDDLDVAGYDAMQDPIKLEVNALLDKAEALGIDTDTIKETAYEDTKNEPEQAYFERVRAELTRAINASTGSRSNQEADGNAQVGQGPDAQRGSRADSREGDGREGAPGADSEGLTAYTPEEVTARQDATAQAEATAKRAEEAAARAEAAAKQASEIAQRSVAAADTFELGGNAEDNLSGQMGLKMSRRGGGQFADIARHFSQYPSRPPAGMPLEEARAFLKARRESMDALVDKYVPKAEGLMLPVQNGGFWGVTKEARPDGDEWRVTRFDKDMEPQGHEAHSSAEAAVADLMASVDPERLADGLMFSRKASGVSVGFKPGTKFLQATSDAGMVGGTVKDGVLRITFSEVDEAQRGQGNGLNLYQALIDQALDDGLKVTSDSTVEAEAVRVYEALGRRGYTVTRLDGGTTEDGAAYGVGATQPAFEVSRSDDVRRSFAGSSAATADRLSLMAAQDRLDAGENAEKVRQETGWHKGVDGRWRFEISDSDAKVDMKLLGNLARGGFDARPIEFVSYRREENGTYTLSLAPANPTRTSDFVSLSGVPESLLPSILPMDAQEAIQRGDGEEDYIGPALDDAKRVRAPFQFEGFNALPLEVVMNHPKLFAAYPALREIMVQVDSTLGNGATFAEMEYVDGTTGKVIKIGNPRAANVDNVLLHEIQHGIQSIEGFATGGTTQAFVEKQSAALPFDVVSGALEIRTFLDKYEKYGTTIDGLKDKPPKMLRDLLESSWALAKSRTTESIQKEYEFSMQAFDPKDSYRRLAGEVEARNTQARQGMSDAERRATPPSATADVADSNVIVVMNGKEMASAPLPANAPAPQAPRTPASTIRTAITKAYGNLLQRLEGKGLVSLTQTEEEAIAAAAQARADQNGGDVEAIKQAMRASVLASEASDIDVKRSADGNLEGFFDPATGKSFLIADNLTAESAPATLMHEVGIHMAADGKLEPLFTRAGNLLKLAKNDPFIQRVQSRMDESGETSNEEAAAYIVTEYEKDRTNAPQSVVNWVKDFIADVRAWLFSKGVLLKADQMTVADIAAVARANARGMANGVDEGQGNAYTGPDANNSPTAKDIERVERLSAVIAKGFGIEQPANESAYKAVSLPDAVALQSIGSAWGKRIIGFDLAAVLKGKSSDFSTVGGVSLSKVYDAIFISLDNDAPHLSVLGHELAHHMRLDEPQIYDDLVVAIRPFIKQEAYRQQFGKELVAAHLQDPDLIREEFIGEVLADGFMEPAFWNALGETSPSLLTRVVDAVVVLIDKARAAVGMQRRTEKYLTDFNRVMEIAGDAMARYAPDAATDIRRSVAGGGQQNLALNTPSPAWMLPQSTKTDALVYELQDQKVDLKRTQEAIKEAGRTITESFDARMAETLMPGRVAYRTETFLKTEVAPLMEAMARNNVSQNELSDYLLARHAPERNTQIAKVNPEMPDGGAGTNSQGVLMTTQAAQDHIAALTAGKRTVLQLLANKIDAITANTRDMLVREGLEKQSTMDAWTGAYKHYVPLFKDEAVESPAHPIGSGLSVTGSASKRAMGSEGEVTNMVAHILMQRESAITRAEKNRVAMSLYGLALSNPNPQVWTTIRPNMSAVKIGKELAAMGVDPVEAEQGMQGVPTIRTINQVTGLVQDTPNPMYKRLENALVVKVDGEDRVVLFNATNPDALRMVRALKNQDGLTNFDLAGSMVGTATRYFASVNTQYNPAFGMVNVVRDIGGALVNLSTTDIADKKAKVLGDIPAAMKGIARDVRGDQQRTPWSDLWVQFQEDGGRTGYRDLFIDPFKRAEAVQKDLDAMQRDGSMSTGKVIHGVLDLLDDFNTTLENGVRLSAYKAALDKGMSRPAAAKMARELTVDFNRKGRTGRELGPLYAFFNASVQGTARTIESLKGPAGKKIIAGGLMLGVMQSLMLAAAGFDDDEPPEFVKARAFIIPMGDKKYIAIPLQFGLNALPNTGRVITDLMMTGGKDWQKKSFDALGEVMGSFNPLGGGNIFTAHGALTMVAPTVADPLIDLATNTNFAGAPIGRERSDWDTRPGDKLARESTKRSMTGQVYIGISKAVNAVSGGNEFKKGLASPTPEQVQYVFTTAGGGLYRELEKTLNIAGLKADGFEIKSRMIPLGGRFAGEVDDQDTQRSRYFKNVQRLGELDTELKGFEKADNDAEVMRIETERKDEADLLGDYKAISRDIAKLNKQAAENITDVEQLKELDAERLELMRELNDSVRKLEKRSTLFNQD